MILTEADAKEKFCKVQPAAVVPQQGIAGSAMAYAFTKCLGSQCCHWRWYDKETGYCGLAGIPRSLGPDGNGAPH